MSHTRVKTTYKEAGAYGADEVKTLFCDHHHTCDCVVFYDEYGEVESMSFEEWSKGQDKWDAMQTLWYPFEGDWGGKLLEGVEYWKESDFKKRVTHHSL